MSDNQSFPYDEQSVASLQRSLSPERFSRYLEASDGDPRAALRRYTWNCNVASALYGPLQTLEVTLRNSVHDALVPSRGARWFSNAQLMKGPDLARVSDARAQAQASA